MNEKFNAELKNSGLTMYELAKQSGISYSLINDIANGKKNINERSAQAVNRLAACLGVTEAEIMNPFCVVEGLKGNYCGITYMVTLENDACINFEYEGVQEKIHTGYQYQIPHRYREYVAAIELQIALFLEEQQRKKELEEAAQKIAERMKHGGTVYTDA